MNLDGLTPEGDLPPNHPLVLEALKGIISGPISELRTKVDNLITNPSNSLNKGGIDYQNILPNIHQNNNTMNRPIDRTAHIANNILNEIAPVQYVNTQQQQPVQVQQVINQPVVKAAPVQESDPNQMELPLFKQPEVKDIHKKLFDIESKLDTIIKYVKNNKN
jgi:hypothetical protein